MPVPSLRTWAVGELLTAAKLNTDLRDGLNYLLAGKPFCQLRKTAVQSIVHFTFTPLTWDTEDIDRDNGHSTSSNTSRYTAQTAGWYHLDTSFNFANASGGVFRVVMFHKNGLSTNRQAQRGGTVSGSGNSYIGTNARIFLGVSDYVETMAFQDSGSGLNVNVDNKDPSFSISWESS